MEIVTLLNQAVTPKKGNKPNFDEAHVLLALDIIKKEQPIGRHLLMRKLGLSEASTRTLIKRLRELGLVNIDKVAGIILSDKGKELLDYFLQRTVVLESIKLDTINWDASCLILRNSSSLIEKIGILELRDLIIRSGATRTLIGIVDLDEKIELPPKTFNESEEVKKLKGEIKEKLTHVMKPYDLVIFFEPRNNYLAYKILLSLL
ncbi:DUF4443 domain-containing protein [Stygiolobus caldivivus]|uniref:DUF4443 domain-containing protein n=1 Tax=Stygiolobus caldivivus TaxID=2824673 RepID=UPI001CECBFBC|nr:DUF4443 domain-containing protein [Stygiolobus caldivivus]